jgi:hypothetical protein
MTGTTKAVREALATLLTARVKSSSILRNEQDFSVFCELDETQPKKG